MHKFGTRWHLFTHERIILFINTRFSEISVLPISTNPSNWGLNGNVHIFIQKGGLFNLDKAFSEIVAGGGKNKISIYYQYSEYFSLNWFETFCYRFVIRNNIFFSFIFITHDNFFYDFRINNKINLIANLIGICKIVGEFKN